MVGAHGSWTVRELGFLFPVVPGGGQHILQQIGAGFGKLSGFWELFSPVKMKKQENTHYMRSFPWLRAYVNLLRQTQMGWDAGTRMGLGACACASVTCSLLDFSYSDSHLDALAGTQLRRCSASKSSLLLAQIQSQNLSALWNTSQAVVSSSSASLFSPRVAVWRGSTTLGLRALPVGDWVSKRAKLCLFWALCPMVSSWTRAGSITVGARGSCWAGACSDTPWVPLFGKKTQQNRWILEYVHLLFSALSCCQH